MAPKKKPPNDAKSPKSGGKPKGKDNASPTKDDKKEGVGKLKPAQSINTRHILVRFPFQQSLRWQPVLIRKIKCEKHAKKEEALLRLRAGNSFEAVAREFSEDKARHGGSLGWKIKGSLDASYEKAAYELEVSPTNSPIIAEAKSVHGYHIIMVEGRK